MRSSGVSPGSTTHGAACLQLGISVERLHRDAHGMAGAELLLLDDGNDPGPVRQARGDLRTAGADHDGGARGAQRLRGG